MEEEESWKQRSFYGEKGEQMKVSFEWEKGENDGFSVVFSHEISINSEYKMEIANQDFWDRGMRPSRVFKSQHFLAIKFVPWSLKKS